MTRATEQALEWLRRRNGDGMFDKNGVVLAAGESAPFMRSTWNKLQALGKIEFYGGKTGKGRLRIKEGQ